VQPGGRTGKKWIITGINNIRGMKTNNIISMLKRSEGQRNDFHLQCHLAFKGNAPLRPVVGA
jgi:hypothetical protein